MKSYSVAHTNAPWAEAGGWPLESTPLISADAKAELKSAFCVIDEALLSQRYLGVLALVHQKLFPRVDPCWGQFRDGPAFIKLHGKRLKELPSPAEASELAINAMKWLNEAVLGLHGNLDPAFIASEIVYMLLHAHPFVDGNGRVARAIGTWVLLRAGYEQLSDLRTYSHERSEQYFGAISAREASPTRPERWHEFFEEMVGHCFRIPIRSK